MLVSVAFKAKHIIKWICLFNGENEGGSSHSPDGKSAAAFLCCGSGLSLLCESEDNFDARALSTRQV